MNKDIFTKIYLYYPQNDIRADLDLPEILFLTWLDESPLSHLSYTQDVFQSMIPFINKQSSRTFRRMLKKLKEMGIIKVTVKNNLSNIELITLDKNELNANSQVGRTIMSDHRTTIAGQTCPSSKTDKPLCVNA